MPPKKAAKKKPTRRKTTTRAASERDMYRARNLECTEETVQELTVHLMRGIPVDRACDLIGLNRQRYSLWCTWGEDYLEAADDEVALMTSDDRDRGELCAKLSRLSRAASAGYLRNVQDDLFESSGKLWQRALHILERRDPKNWTRIHARSLGVGDDLGDQFAPDESFL